MPSQRSIQIYSLDQTSVYGIVQIHSGKIKASSPFREKKLKRRKNWRKWALGWEVEDEKEQLTCEALPFCSEGNEGFVKSLQTKHPISKHEYDVENIKIFKKGCHRRATT